MVAPQVCWQREHLKDPLYQDATAALTRPATTAKHFDFGACLGGDADQVRAARGEMHVVRGRPAMLSSLPRTHSMP